MKGKNKLVFVMFAILALVATSVCFAFAKKGDNINYVTANEIAGYTADYDGVIFSVERVYFAQDNGNKDKNLEVDGYEFKRIETNTGSRYFGDIGLSTNVGNFNHKDVVHNGDFVMVDDTVSVTADDVLTGNDVTVKQGIMVTLGGYYYASEDDGSTIKTNETIDGNENGATITYVSASATLNGVAQDLPSARSFGSGEFEDFTWFIEVPEDASTEGHYEMTFEYMSKGSESVSRFNFNFYLLLKSQYNKEVEINDQTYQRDPQMADATWGAGEWSYNLGGDNFPTLTFDYSRFDLQIVHSSGDVTRTIDFDYNDLSKRISLTSQIHDDTEVEYYTVPIDFDSDEKIVTLMFVDNGRYTFKFNYIYEYNGQKITIPTNQESITDIVLNIYGYQLKYSKAGVNSADMEYLEIYRNNTMFILLNGFTDASGESSSANLGVNYKIVDDVNYKTGKRKDRKNAIISQDEFNDPTNVKYQKTDRGIWLALNDEYLLEIDSGLQSFYYHSTSKFEVSDLTEDGKKPFTKVTTFTTPGYYLVQVAYQYGASDIGYQYFAFEITSATPILNLYSTEAEDIDQVDDKRADFYAYEFTKNNVYANWRTPEIFESTILGKLYYSTSTKYASEKALREMADRGVGAGIVEKEYEQETFIKDSGSYLLVLEVGGTATKTYTFFTIDKDDISGLTVHEVNPIYIGSKIGYQLTQNASLNYITHTEKAVIDVMFALDWNAKESGAKISAKYRYTPFVKNNDTTKGTPIKAQGANTYYNYIINEYKLGDTTNFINFEWVNDGFNVNADNVMIEQGIYEFALEDQAGNKLNYVMILDQTEAVVLATYGDANEQGEKAKYVSGQMVADYVEMDWGTHKAIDLCGYKSETTVDLLLDWVNDYGQSDDDLFTYYNKENGNNLSRLTSMFKPNVGSKNLMVVENEYSKIQIVSNNYKDKWFKLISAIPSNDENNPENDYKAFVNSGIEMAGWNNDDAKVFVTTLQGGTYQNIAGTEEFEYTGTVSDLKISVNPDYLCRYIVGVKGINNVSNIDGTQFAVYITPDKTLGQVFSATIDDGLYETAVQANGQNTNLNITENDRYYDGQASDDGVFVFEWTSPTEKDSFEVVDIQYEYYQLMDQGALSAIKSDEKVNDLGNEEFYYYPYKYVRSEHILEIDEQGVQKVKNYTEDVTRTSNGQTSKVNRSNPINLGYETFYEDNELVTRSVTQTGLYIITRTIKMTEGESKDAESEFSYAFFVDRNMIIGYDVNDIKQKLVGQFIHLALPNSEGEEEIKYDNFTKQGAKPISVTISDDKSINTSVYLQTNKLPTRLKVPTGKYVSGDVNSRVIAHTSNVNMSIKLNVYFRDSYGILQGSYTYGTIQIITEADVGNTIDGYIPFTLDVTAQARIYNMARKHTDPVLTVPGTYVFEIMDRVGYKINDVFEVTDYNSEAFAIELLNHAPKTDVYAYANINNITSDKQYSEDLRLYTNQQYVEFIIPKEDKNAYMAQLDIGSVVVHRNDLGSKPWLKFIYTRSNGNGTLSFDKDGAIKENKDNKYFEDKGTYWVIKLDTGLKVEDGVIVDYEEYVYTISISYILENSDESYYTYVDQDGKEQSFYNTVYNVFIDRTPSDDNLKEIIKGQEEYFTGYHTWLADENGTEFDKEINDNFAYRDSISVRDYYALTNKLYYEYADKNGKLSNQAMYAITIDSTTQFNNNELKAAYYRKLNLSGGAARERMGLLPIIEEYATSNEYFVFSEAVGEYFNLDITSNLTYAEIIDDEDCAGGLYEFVEIDLAGNYTQYVVYFKLEDTRNAEVVINAKELSETKTQVADVPVELNKDKATPKSFINYEHVSGVNNLAKVYNDSKKQYYPYYGQINVYRGTELVESIYLNTTAINQGYDDKNKNYADNDISSRLNEVLKYEGNYDIYFIDVFGQSVRATVNVYESDEHSLNTLALVRKKSPDGDYYVEFSGLNTPVGNAWWFVTEVKVKHNGLEDPIEFTASQKNGITTLTLESEYPDDDEYDPGVKMRNESDRLYLTKVDTSYIITVTDVAYKKTSIPISTIEDYIPYQLNIVGNSYSKDNVVYTANDVVVEYDKDVYDIDVGCYDINGDAVANEGWKEEDTRGKMRLLADNNINMDHLGGYRKFIVTIKLEDKSVVTYQVVIDTRVLESFAINNLNLISCLDKVKSEFNGGGYDSDLNKMIEDYKISSLLKPEYYNKLINETINIVWTPQSDNSYFRYTYQLFEFVNSDKYEELLYNPQDAEYQISPKDKTTGKYIFKVTITAENGKWIASRVYGIAMSTTVSGLYEVRYTDGTPREYSAITNWEEIDESLKIKTKTDDIAKKLGLSTVESLDKAIESFGRTTAIPLYIANEPLELHSNKDNGVDANCLETELNNGNTIISVYRVWRSNYQTFAVIMQVNTNKNSMGGSNILNEFKIESKTISEDLLNSSASKTVYDDTADYYTLKFDSYYANTSEPTALEKHNKIKITILYAGQEVNTIFGDDTPGGITYKEFHNSGTYKLRISDIAGNKHTFKTATSYTDIFNLVLMRKNEILYTMTTNPETGGKAPIKYPYYDKPVTMQIDRQNNYDINSINVQVYLNSKPYTGFEHPTGSTTYTFNDYGTYLVRVTANLLNIKNEDGTPVKVNSDIVFTILNPNEARRALDFTSIYSYDIIKVESVSNGVYKDVTEKFMTLLDDAPNVSDINVYNRLITYERAVEVFGSSIKGKMKFRVQYRVQDDELLPARYEEFSFTLNNQTATLSASIEAGGKTTKPVTIRFNAANIYELVGDCNIVINGEKVDAKIDENAPNRVIELTIDTIGEYYVQLVGDSGNVISTFNFTIKEPMNAVSIILIVVVSVLVIGLIGTFIWLRTRMKVR